LYINVKISVYVREIITCIITVVKVYTLCFIIFIKFYKRYYIQLYFISCSIASLVNFIKTKSLKIAFYRMHISPYLNTCLTVLLKITGYSQ